MIERANGEGFIFTPSYDDDDDGGMSPAKNAGEAWNNEDTVIVDLIVTLSKWNITKEQSSL